MTLRILSSKRELGVKTTEITNTDGNHLTFNILFLIGDTVLIMGIYSSSFRYLRGEKANG
jgi:hypothetical protein